jgi:hypothetical protein
MERDAKADAGYYIHHSMTWLTNKQDRQDKYACYTGQLKSKREQKDVIFSFPFYRA